MAGVMSTVGISNSENGIGEWTSPDLDAALSCPELVASAALATPVAIHPELPDDDENSPAHLVAMSHAISLKYTIAKKRAGSPCVELRPDDSEESRLFTDAETAAVADSSFPDRAIPRRKTTNEIAPPVFNYDAASFEDEEMRKEIRATPPPDTREETEDIVANRDTRRVTIDERTRDSTDDVNSEIIVPPSADPEHDDSTLCVPEAWRGMNDNGNETANEVDGEAFVAKPLLPWQKQEQTWLNAWSLLCLFSTIALIARETDDYPKGRRNETRAQNVLTTTCLALSVSFSALFSIAHVESSTLGRLLVGTILEGIVALILVGTWVGTMFVIMEPTFHWATTWVEKDEGRLQATVANANLYLGSWGAVVCALAVLTMFLWERFGKSGGMGMWYASKWCLLVLASVITFIEGLVFRNQICFNKNWDLVACDKNSYGTISGFVGVIVSSFMTILSYCGRDSTLITTIVGLVMVVIYTLCTGLLCFGNGPATYVSNQYFWARAGFFLSCSVFVNGLNVLPREQSSKNASPAPEAETGGDGTPRKSLTLPLKSL